jgi:hypothetical protein
MDRVRLRIDGGDLVEGSRRGTDLILDGTLTPMWRGTGADVWRRAELLGGVHGPGEMAYRVTLSFSGCQYNIMD